MHSPLNSQSDKLVHDFKAVVADAEAILHATAGQSGKEITELRASMTQKLNNAKDHLISAEQVMVEKAKQAIKATDEYVHEFPWQSAAIAGGVGLLVGYLVSNSRKA